MIKELNWKYFFEIKGGVDAIPFSTCNTRSDLKFSNIYFILLV